MQVENAFPEQIEELKEIVDEMQKVNPEIATTSVTMDELNVLKKVEQLEEKVDKILMKLELIFGDHVLINGSFNNQINFSKT